MISQGQHLKAAAHMGITLLMRILRMKKKMNLEEEVS
jgi:hypothetical protein